MKTLPGPTLGPAEGACQWLVHSSQLVGSHCIPSARSWAACFCSWNQCCCFNLTVAFWCSLSQSTLRSSLALQHYWETKIGSSTGSPAPLTCLSPSWPELVVAAGCFRLHVHQSLALVTVVSFSDTLILSVPVYSKTVIHLTSWFSYPSWSQAA